MPSSHLKLPVPQLSAAKVSAVKLSNRLHHKRTQIAEVSWVLSAHQIQSEVLELVATRADLPVILDTLTTKIEQLSSGARCAILLLCDDGLLRLGSGPRLPESYRDLINQGVPVGADIGTCGTAIYTGEPASTFDVMTDPKWDACREVVLGYGFRAYWSNPILDSTGQAIATFAMIYDRPCHPTQLDRRLIEMSSYLAGIAIERQRSDEQYAKLNASLEYQVAQRTAQLEQALAFEATLKRITDKVRDSLDEDQILQTTVAELGQVLGVDCCDAGIYNLRDWTSTITYEFTSSVSPAKGLVVNMHDYADVYSNLLQGQYLQFAFLSPFAPRIESRHATILACPILDNSSVLGDLWLFKPRDKYFTSQEIHLVQQVANQCAIALRQSRLHQAVQDQVQEFQRLSHLKDDFLSTVSHELRTPMANIKMDITMLATCTLTTKAQKYLDILSTECSRESDLINDLLDLQRLENAGMVECNDRIDVNQRLQALAEPFEYRASQQQQGLEVQIAEEPVVLETNLPGFDRVVTELINNACKYTAAGGTIRVKVEQQGNGVTIVVCNQATIPASELTHIFDKFYRVPNADPWKKGGTGLGLALVKKLIERMHGSITVRSESGWTCFRVHFDRLG